MTFYIIKKIKVKSLLMGQLMMFLFLAACMSSCKKEYIDKFNIVPGDSVKVIGDNYITAFKVKEFSPDTMLKASIVKDSIVVYWPSYKPLPGSIKPDIILSDKATISPASGVEISFKTGTVFKVTAQSGKVHTYILKVAINQPIPYFGVTPNQQFGQGLLTALGGDLWLRDTAITKVYFIDSLTQKSYRAEVISVDPKNGPVVFIGEDIPVGTKYDVKVTQGVRIAYNKYPTAKYTIQIIQPNQPLINTDIGFPLSLKAGDAFTVRGFHTSKITDVYISQDYDGPRLKLQIVSSAMGKLTLKIPLGTAPGDYNWIRPISLESPTGDEIVSNGLITVQP